MAQQFIDFGSFPNDPTADPIRAAFQKIQENFTDIYNTTTNAGVTTLTVGAGLRSFGGTAGNILVIANIPTITMNTTSSLLVGVGAATTNTATISTSTTPFVLGLAPNITTTNANFTGLTRTSNLQVANFVTSALIPNANVTYDLGTSSLRWRDLYLSGSTLYLGPQAIGANATSVNLSSLVVSSNITVGNISISGSTVTSGDAGVTGNITVSGTFNISKTVGGHLRPTLSEVYDLGNSVNRWRSLTITNNGITIGTQSITANATSVIVSGIATFGNVSAGNASLGNLTTSNYFRGNGSLLTSITGANVTDQVGNALIAGTVYTAAQPNITSVGTLTSLAVTGNVSGDSLSFSNISLSKYVASNLIPSVNETYDLGNSSFRWRDLYLSGSTLYLGPQTISANASGVNLSGNVTFNNVSAANSILGNTATSNYFIGNGALLSSITGANVTGQVGNSLITGTVYTAAQPNITSVGTLSSLTVSGNIVSSSNLNASNISANYVLGNLIPYSNEAQDLGNETHRWRDLWLSGNTLRIGSTVISANSNTTTITGSVLTTSVEAGTVTATLVGGTLTTNAQPNITTVGILSNLSISGNTSTGDLSVIGNISAANLETSISITSPTFIGNLQVPNGGTIAAPGNTTQLLFNDSGNTAAVPGMTFDKNSSLLTILGNVAGGNLTSSGGLSVSGDASIGNVSTTGVSATGNISGGNLITLGIVSATGNLVGGNVVTNGFLSVNGNASIGSITTTTINGTVVSVSGNVSGANLVASGILSVQGSATVGSLSTGGNVLASGILQATGNVVGGNLRTGGALVVTGAASVGSLTSGNISAGAVNGSIFTATMFTGNGASITWINGSNVNGIVGLATSASTVSSSSQPTITSLGTLTSLSVAGAFSGSNVSASGYMLASVATGIAAAGTTLSGATQLAQQVNVIGTCTAGTADGVRLPGATTGMQIVIVNTTASICKVYPQNGSTIDSLGLNIPFPLGAGARLMIIAATTTQWYSMVGVYG
jgi:hypothetical protein